MRAINAPLYDALTVYQTCVDSVGNADLKARLNAVKGEIGIAVNEYKDKAPLANLFQVSEFNGKDDDVVVGRVSKKELKTIYSNQMVDPNKTARKIYDELKLGAPLNICPFCGFGHVWTLDHYLPKAKYPFLSVLPINLVPSCSDCNKEKSTSVATTASQQCIHPYFDHDLCATEQWLFADVEETVPVSIRYFTNPPASWDMISKARVQAHFSDFKLSTRYRTQATNELATLKGLLVYDFDINGADGVHSELVKRATVALNLHRNSWNTAMFQALAASEWYCNGGFRAE